MAARSSATLRFGAAATFVLSALLPAMMAPASKSSPLLLSIAAGLALAALAADEGWASALGRLRRAVFAPPGAAALLLVAWMAVSTLWSHDRAAAIRQFLEFAAPLAAGGALLLAFPKTADPRRVLWSVLAVGATALLVIVDLRTGLSMREWLGARAQPYSYNRALVTLVVLAAPVLALCVARGWARLALAMLPLPFAVGAGESATAVLGLAILVLVLPIAWLLPRFARGAGLAAALVLLALSPAVGTVARMAIGSGLHQAMASAHSDDRVAIWLSFEAAAQRRLPFGNGFGSSLAMQKSPVAAEIAPDLRTLLGASHPHNAFLQLWVELGAVGAALAAALFVFWFRAIGRSDPRLQPFLLAWTAVVCGVALVSHGAWQAWWAAAIAASAAGFLATAHEMRDPASARPL